MFDAGKYKRDVQLDAATLDKAGMAVARYGMSIETAIHLFLVETAWGGFPFDYTKALQFAKCVEHEKRVVSKKRLEELSAVDPCQKKQ